jgi:hypothetical protein
LFKVSVFKLKSEWIKIKMPTWTLRIFYDSSEIKLGKTKESIDNSLICRVECMKEDNYDNSLNNGAMYQNEKEHQDPPIKKQQARHGLGHEEQPWANLASKADQGYLDNVDFCDVQNLPYEMSKRTLWSAAYMHGATWKWLPLGDNFVDVVSFRDIDAVLSDREYFNF